jgi:hypothetical protein
MTVRIHRDGVETTGRQYVRVAFHGGEFLFTGAPGSFVEALNATTGEALGHAKLQAPLRVPPSAWELDGNRYLLVGAGNTWYAFTLKK